MTTELTGNWGAQFAACLRLMLVSAVILCVLYPLVILAVGRTFTPWTAAGSCCSMSGVRWWAARRSPRLSPAGIFLAAPLGRGLCRQCHGRQHLSPAGDALRERALESLKSLEATPQRKVPADLVTARAAAWIRTLP